MPGIVAVLCCHGPSHCRRLMSHDAPGCAVGLPAIPVPREEASGSAFAIRARQSFRSEATASSPPAVIRRDDVRDAAALAAAGGTLASWARPSPEHRGIHSRTAGTGIPGRRLDRPGQTILVSSRSEARVRAALRDPLPGARPGAAAARRGAAAPHEPGLGVNVRRRTRHGQVASPCSPVGPARAVRCDPCGLRYGGVGLLGQVEHEGSGRHDRCCHFCCRCLFPASEGRGQGCDVGGPRWT